MKNFGKNYESRLTGGDACAIVMASDVEVRCVLRQLATVKAAISRIYRFAVSLSSLSLPGALRRGVTVHTSSTPAGSLFVPAVEGREESRKSSMYRRSTCTAISSRQPCNSSRTGSSPRSTRPRRNAGRASANSGAIRIPPVRPRRRSKSNISEPRSATRFSLSASCGGNSARFTQKTHYAQISGEE